MCAWGSSFQWFMGIIGGSTRANRPNRMCRVGAYYVLLVELLKKPMGGHLLGYGRLIGIIRYLNQQLIKMSQNFKNRQTCYLQYFRESSMLMLLNEIKSTYCQLSLQLQNIFYILGYVSRTY